MIFEAAKGVYEQMQQNWQENRESLFAQLVSLVEQFIASGKIQIEPAVFEQDDLRRRLITTHEQGGPPHLGSYPLPEHGDFEPAV
jgi:hypothetical protein